jgi:hypothetical protein
MTKTVQMRRLETVLATYGAQPERWPAAERAALETCVAECADARALLAEEAAFDRLLSAAPDKPGAVVETRVRAALLEKFEAENAALPSVSGVVVPFARKGRTQAPVSMAPSIWKELSVMAAALLIGFFTVTQGLLEGSNLDPVQLTGSVSEESDDASTLALGTPTIDEAEEELL